MLRGLVRTHQDIRTWIPKWPYVPMLARTPIVSFIVPRAGKFIPSFLKIISHISCLNSSIWHSPGLFGTLLVRDPTLDSKNALCLSLNHNSHLKLWVPWHFVKVSLPPRRHHAVNKCFLNHQNMKYYWCYWTLVPIFLENNLVISNESYKIMPTLWFSNLI